MYRDSVTSWEISQPNPTLVPVPYARHVSSQFYPAVEAALYTPSSRSSPASSFSPAGATMSTLVRELTMNGLMHDQTAQDQVWTETCYATLAKPSVNSRLLCSHREPTVSGFSGRVSPFTDCFDRIGPVPISRYPRPRTGRLNSYVKFRWVESVRCDFNRDGFPEQQTPPTTGQVLGCHASHVSYDREVLFEWSSPSGGQPESQADPTNVHLSPSGPRITSRDERSSQIVNPFKPRMQPPEFGFVASVDAIDRKTWDFCMCALDDPHWYPCLFRNPRLRLQSATSEWLRLTCKKDIKNWCPGRIVLKRTNPWLNDFASLQAIDGVRAAILSLAGVYIYDYVPRGAVRRRVNANFHEAERRLCNLLNSQEPLSNRELNECITIAVILSMQDVRTRICRGQKMAC